MESLYYTHPQWATTIPFANCFRISFAFSCLQFAMSEDRRSAHVKHNAHGRIRHERIPLFIIRRKIEMKSSRTQAQKYAEEPIPHAIVRIWCYPFRLQTNIICHTVVHRYKRNACIRSCHTAQTYVYCLCRIMEHWLSDAKCVSFGLSLQQQRHWMSSTFHTVRFSLADKIKNKRKLHRKYAAKHFLCRGPIKWECNATQWRVMVFLLCVSAATRQRRTMSTISFIQQRHLI